MTLKSALMEKPLVDLAASGLKFRKLCEAGRSLPTRFDCMTGSPDEELLDMIQTQMTYRSVGYYIAENYMVTYDGNIFCDSHMLSSYTLNVSEFNKTIINHFLNEDARCNTYIDAQAVVLNGFGWNQYGHWLLEILTKVFVFESFLFDLNSLKWIVPSEIPEFALEFLKIIGIKRQQLIFFDQKNEILKVKYLFIPTNLGRATYAAHPIFKSYARWIRSTATKNFCFPDEKNKIFTHRKNVLNVRKIRNEENVIRIAKEYGYTAISPETFSISDQIKIFSTAISICGQYGSALHNSIFSPDGIVVTAIRHKGADIGLSQSSVCAAHSQKMSYVFCNNESDGLDINIDRFRWSLDYAESVIEDIKSGRFDS